MMCYLFLGANMIKVNRLEEAEKLYLGLIKRNPENHMYYHQLEVAKGATTIEEKLEIYAEMSEKYPKAQSPQRLALEIAQVPIFFFKNCSKFKFCFLNLIHIFSVAKFKFCVLNLIYIFFCTGGCIQKHVRQIHAKGIT